MKLRLPEIVHDLPDRRPVRRRLFPPRRVPEILRRYAKPHSYTNANTESDTYSYFDCVANCDSYGYIYAYTNPNSYTYFDTETFTNAETGVNA